jgi:hypothetical protein
MRPIFDRCDEPITIRAADSPSAQSGKTGRGRVLGDELHSALRDGGQMWADLFEGRLGNPARERLVLPAPEETLDSFP